MASASIPPTANHESNIRIGISIGLFVLFVIITIFAAGFINQFGPPRSALRSTRTPYMIRSQQRTGIGRFQLASIPIIKYQAGVRRDEPPNGRVFQKELPPKVASLATCEEREDTSLSDDGPGQPNCSICTECFQERENVRVLPCSHIFHRHCIDPWLLNFSGTCPLWLVNIQEMIRLFFALQKNLELTVSGSLAGKTCQR